MRQNAETSRSSYAGVPIWKLTRSSGGTGEAAVVSLTSETFAAFAGRSLKASFGCSRPLLIVLVLFKSSFPAMGTD